VFSWENGEVSIKDFDNKFGDVGGLPFLFLWLLNEERENAVEWLNQLPGIKDYFLDSFF
jgi:hypothetical protein